MAKNSAKKLATSQRKKWQQKLQQNAAKPDAGSPKTLRVVLDANIWYSAILYGGAPEAVADFCLENSRIVLSEALLEELVLKLRHRAGTPYRWAKLIRQELHRLCDVVPTGAPVNPITRDPKDEHVVIAALERDCAIIVSGDGDLLEVGIYKGIAFVTPAEFLELAKAEAVLQ